MVKWLGGKSQANDTSQAIDAHDPSLNGIFCPGSALGLTSQQIAGHETIDCIPVRGHRPGNLDETLKKAPVGVFRLALQSDGDDLIRRALIIYANDDVAD